MIKLSIVQIFYVIPLLLLAQIYDTKKFKTIVLKNSYFLRCLAGMNTGEKILCALCYVTC